MRENNMRENNMRENNMRENNMRENNMRKNNRNKLYIVFGVIFVVIFLIFFTITFRINKDKEKALKEAEQKATEYLYEKYNKKFNLKFNSEGYKSKVYWIDHYFQCGHDKNIKEYVFTVYSLDDVAIKSYITVWKNLTTNQFEVSEGNKINSGGNIIDTSYKVNKEIYDVKSALEKILLDNYDDYKIEYNDNLDVYDNYDIKIVFNHSIVNELKNDLKNIDSIIKLLKDKNKITITIVFNDFTRKYNGNKKIDVERNLYSLINQVKLYLDKNYKYDYSLLEGYNDLEIKFPVKIKEKYYSEDKELYTKLFDELHNIAIKNHSIISLHFIDHIAKLSENAEYYNNLEEYIKFLWK